MLLVKDNSRDGNDCYIYDRWYFCDDLSLLIHIVKYSHDDDLTETTSHKCNDMQQGKQIIKRFG